MNAVAPRISIARIIDPRSIAIIGASESIGKFGGRVMHSVVRHGYRGRVLPINPARESVFGVPAYRDIFAAPGPIDLAVVAVPAAQLVRTIAECADAGVGACIVITAQLGEFDSAGAALQNEAVALARGAGMRLLGPNCLGIISPASRLALSSTVTLQHVAELRPGPVALVSQSGALMGALFILGHDHGVGFSHMVSVGNQADLELCDFLECLIEDDGTSVICLYIEEIKSPARFTALARRATAAGKRLLAVKAGRTEAGGALARSHTASLAGSYAAFEAVCRATGVLLMDEPEGMILVAGIMAANPRLGPGDIGLVVSSGGAGAVTADRITEARLPLATWQAATRDRLQRHFLATHVTNPIDLGAHAGGFSPEALAATIRAVAEDPGVALFSYIMTPQPAMEQAIDATVALWRSAGKPCVLVLDASSLGASLGRRLTAAGLPFVSRIDDGLRAIDAMVRERRLLAELALPAAVRPAGIGAAVPPPPGPMTEPEVKRLLQAYGIPTTREELATTAEQAVAAADSIGYPVVLKAVARSVVHKSDFGLVKLGLREGAAVRRAFAELESSLAEVAPGAPVLVQEMVHGGAELILGARYDEAFGPQVLVGFGGILVELVRDVQTEVAPLGRAKAEAALRRLALWPVLAGVRGGPPLDAAAAADAIVRLSWLAADLGPRLRELDVNPLLVRRAGDGVIAVDGRATIV